MTHPLRETIARALAPLAWAALGAGDSLAQKNRRTASLRHADAVLSAIEAAGLVMVPAYPPDAAIWAGCDTARQRYDKTCKRCPREVYTPYGLGTQACRLEGHDIYQAMVKAAATSDNPPPPAAP